MSKETTKVKYSGSCHCKAVTFEVEAPSSVEIENCNCSICSKFGYLHLIVPKRDFNIISGEQHLSTYTFNSGVAEHTFCSVCGVKPFYIPRSNPDGVDVNLRCLDEQPEKVTIVEFNGQSWEENAHTLAHKSL